MIKEQGKTECENLGTAESIHCLGIEDATVAFEEVYEEIRITFEIAKYDYLLEEEALSEYTGWESIDHGIPFHKGDDEEIKRWAEEYVHHRVDL